MPEDGSLRAARQQALHDAKVAAYYARLRPFESAQLEAFGSDVALSTYLDTLAYLEGDAGLDALDGAPVPLPGALSSRFRPAGPDPRMRTQWLALVGPHSAQDPCDGAPRIVRQGSHVVVLQDNELRCFALDPEGTLRASSALTLGPAYPQPVIEAVVGEFGERVERRYFPEGSLRGVGVWDQVLGTVDGVVVLASRQDLLAVEVVRVAIDRVGRMRITDSRLIHFLAANDGEGYRARMVDGALVVYFSHAPLFEDPVDGVTAYTLPATGDADGVQGVHALLGGSDVLRPLLHTRDQRLHTLARCDLSEPGLRCAAQAIAAPAADQTLVGSDAVYFWSLAHRAEGTPVSASVLFRLPFDGTPGTGVRLRAPRQGIVSMAAAPDGHIHLIAPGEDRAEHAWLDVPSALFSSSAPALPGRQYRHLPPPTTANSGGERVVFVGSHLLRDGSDASHWQMGSFTPGVDLLALRGGPANGLWLGHAASALATAGTQLLAVGTDNWHLHMSLISLGADPPVVVAKHILRDAVRDLSGHGAATWLQGVGDGGWWLVELLSSTAGGDGSEAALMPLHFTAGESALATFPSWSAVPLSQRPGRAPGVEVLGLGPELVVTRLNDTLLVHRFDPVPRLTQRIEWTQ